MIAFEQFFKVATGHTAFQWQKRLCGEFRKGNFPPRCNVPTGLGKTSIIAIWLSALAEDLRNPSEAVGVPRRLVYIVDRRVVVDQATDEAEALLGRLKNAAASSEQSPITDLARCLLNAGCTTNTEPFAVSTLRGQHADNRRWLRDPTRPAVIIGTVDMIGSRLLFSGYGGLGRYSRSLHAGLLAQDALIVLDEAHLCPAFVETLAAQCRQLMRRPSIKPFHVMLLSATQVPIGEAPSIATGHANGDDFALQPEHDLKDAEVVRRLQAVKSLQILAPPEGDARENANAFARRMAASAVALAGQNAAIVIFANTVELINQVSAALKTSPHSIPSNQIQTLTGEMRGKERDELIEQPTFARFRQRRQARGELDAPIFLVATAAAEVGINFDADHAVCDLVTLERMVQRFGRVNRFGDGAAKICVVLSNALPLDDSQAATLRLLQSLHKTTDGLDASPLALTQLITSHPDAPSAFAPRPPCPPLDEARLDDWSLTTLSGDEFARPQVSYWLRGLTPDDRPHTWLAWRADLDYAATAEDASQMAQVIPLRPSELAQVNTVRAGELVGKLCERAPAAFAALLDLAGTWSGIKLGDLPKKKESRDRLLRFTTLVLPAGVGGLKNGLLDEVHQEVRDVVETSVFHRVLLQRTADGWQAYHLPLKPSSVLIGAYESASAACRGVPDALGLSCKFLSVSGFEDESDEGRSGDPEGASERRTCRVAYFTSPDAETEFAMSEDFVSLQPADVPLEKHNLAVADVARRLTGKLGLSTDLADAVIQACIRHDLGKRQPQWQKAIGNPHGPLLAKSANRGFDHTATGGYRHEFGSLLDALYDPALANHTHRELILHLIAAHHGHARPGFATPAFDTLPLRKKCVVAAHESSLRFARLQQQLGWWQLAYLESLVKCADALVSAEGS